MKGEVSENDLRYKAETYCSSMERCVVDVEAKLSQWGATPEMMEKIVRHLQDERYIDQKRFCSAFVRDKYRFNQWGRVKICQALRMKKIPAGIYGDTIWFDRAEKKKCESMYGIRTEWEIDSFCSW